MDAATIMKQLEDMRELVISSVDADGNPQSRVIEVGLVEGEHLIFLTARGKDFYRELMANPHISVIGFSMKTWIQIRITCKVHHFEGDKQHEMVDRVIKRRPSIGELYPGDSRYILEAFEINSGTIETYDLSSQKIKRHEFTFGGAESVRRGYFITDDCTGCGTCAMLCPQQCIIEGDPYRIDPDHCEYCGLCQENCPSDAIIRTIGGKEA